MKAAGLVGMGGIRERGGGGDEENAGFDYRLSDQMCCANSACEVCAGVHPAAGRKEKNGEKEEKTAVNKADGQFKGWGFPFPA